MLDKARGDYGAIYQDSDSDLTDLDELEEVGYDSELTDLEEMDKANNGKGM